MNNTNEEIRKKLELLSKDDLYKILKISGIDFPTTKKEDLTKEELLLVSDEADQTILKKQLGIN